MAPFSAQRLAGLASGRIAIWGLGEEGSAALDYLAREVPGARFAVLLDAAAEAEPVRRQLSQRRTAGAVEVLAGAERPRDLSGFDLVIKSPGVSLYRPEIEAARAAGVAVTSATQLFFDLPPTGRVVCVTGTKGKSTTVTMLTRMLERAGVKARAVGNIGRHPLASAAGLGSPGEPAAEAPPTVWVMEVSSYQAADLDAAPDLGVLLNLHPEHLTWHGGEGRYFEDKLRLFTRLAPGAAVVNGGDARIVERLDRFREPVLFNHRDGFHPRDGEIWRGEERIAARGSLPLAGEHDRVNACAALTAASRLGAPLAAALEALAEHRGLPHRLQRLGERDGLLWVDDSLATIPAAALAALAAFSDRPATLLLGGHDRGVGYDDLAAGLVAHPAHAVVCLPENGARIAEAVRRELGRSGARGRPELFEADDLETAVEIARRETPPGGVVLLSPAAASFGRFRDYRERGRAFAAAAGF